MQRRCAVARAGEICLLSAAVGSCAFAVGGARADGGRVSNGVQGHGVTQTGGLDAGDVHCPSCSASRCILGIPRRQQTDFSYSL